MDKTIFTIIRSIYISGTATLIALPIGIFLAYRLALRGISEWASTFLESFAGFPTVVLRLILYFILNSSGPLGYFHILYTPIAIIIGDAILVIPIVASIGYRIQREKVLRISELTTTLGGTKNQNMLILIQEAFNGLLATTVMAFSRAISELGVALMVGGNISGYTRVMMTAIALQISKGMFSDSLQLGLALVAIIVVIGIALKVLGGSLEVD